MTTKIDMEKLKEINKLCPALCIQVWGSDECRLRKYNEFHDSDVEEIAATMLKLAEEKKKAVEEAIDETTDKLNDEWFECIKAALSGEELFDDEMSTEQRKAVELIWAIPHRSRR